MNIMDEEDDDFNMLVETYLRALLIVDAVENGWTVKKVSDSSFQFKKSLQQYVMDDMEPDVSLFTHFINALAGAQIEQ